ncbi:hypothetical protein LC653_02000 [Nostoc sp. CHAB 5784]|uniref:hypothetical protein n=1 Tax=Nostoc mirabile TaxID=2907820 RepID=UPI001E37B16C|nr:hypothetical protein [Nostoc mirabile]MCC5662733.1 hypothetical protein [Nostoc mirabile CHAB5784]
MNITMYYTNSAQKEYISETDPFLSKGINIYNDPLENLDSKRPSVKMPYGIYLGGDISTGGGEPVGVNTWVAWRDVERSNVKK